MVSSMSFYYWHNNADGFFFLSKRQEIRFLKEKKLENSKNCVRKYLFLFSKEHPNEYKSHPKSRIVKKSHRPIELIKLQDTEKGKNNLSRMFSNQLTQRKIR